MALVNKDGDKQRNGAEDGSDMGVTEFGRQGGSPLLPVIAHDFNGLSSTLMLCSRAYGPRIP